MVGNNGNKRTRRTKKQMTDKKYHTYTTPRTRTQAFLVVGVTDRWIGPRTSTCSLGSQHFFFFVQKEKICFKFMRMRSTTPSNVAAEGRTSRCTAGPPNEVLGTGGAGAGAAVVVADEDEEEDDDEEEGWELLLLLLLLEVCCCCCCCWSAAAAKGSNSGPL